MLNKTELAAPLGLSVPAITEWLSILEITGQIILVPPFFENFGKRLIKSPKLYFVDSGLVCYLLGISDRRVLEGSSFSGPVFEGFVASEIVKHQINAGQEKALYYFRDQQGLEIDFIVPQGGGRLALIEAKATRTPKPDMARSVTRLAESITRHETMSYVVCMTSPKVTRMKTLSSGVRVTDIRQLSEIWT